MLKVRLNKEALYCTYLTTTFCCVWSILQYTILVRTAKSKKADRKKIKRLQKVREKSPKAPVAQECFDKMKLEKKIISAQNVLHLAQSIFRARQQLQFSNHY